MTCPDTDTLAAIADLPEDKRAVIVDHAASCSDCRALLVALVAPLETLVSSPPAISRPASDADPTKIDRYRIERRIGAGAMGVVFAAYDPELARPLAIKVLRSGGSAERMRREAQALAKLTHANVVAVYDVGEHDGATFVAMALVDGENLRTWLRGERTTEQIVDAIVQATRGVDAAHRAGIVHRDLKPDNIFVAQTGEVLVGDFGLARTEGAPREPSDRVADSSELTRTGTVIGTPAYMAPEQIDGDASPASDQFALCVTAWEALYGSRPFSGKTIGELATAVGAGPPPEPTTRKVPAHVRAAIRRGLAANPTARHSSLAAMLAALAPPRRRRWPYVALAIAAAGATTAMLALRGADGDPQAVAIARCEAQSGPAAWRVERKAASLARLAGPHVKPAVRPTVERIVERYVAGWTDLRRETCVANARHTVSDPVLAATTRCLDRRAATLAWALERTTLLPVETLLVVESLEPIETCRSIAASAPPSAEIASLQEQLDQASALSLAAPDRVVDLESLAARANELGDPSTQAEASFLQGVVRYSIGYDSSELLRQAIAFAEKAQDDRIRTRALAMLAVVAARSGRLTDATAQRDVAVSALPRTSDPRTAAAVERATREITFKKQDFPAERAALLKIETIVRDRFGEPSRSMVDVLYLLAGNLQRTSDPDGPALLERAIAMDTLFADPSSLLAVEQAGLRANLPSARVQLSERSVEIARREAPDKLPMALSTLAYDYELSGDYDGARRSALESLALVEAAPHGRTDLPTAADLLDEAAAMSIESAYQTDDEAVRAKLLVETLAFLDRFPPETRDGDAAQSMRGRALLLQGRYLDALPLLTKALSAAESADEPNLYRIGVRAFSLAQALWETGGARERDRARALADQAARLLPEARAIYSKDPNYATALDRLDLQAALLADWRKKHR